MSRCGFVFILIAIFTLAGTGAGMAQLHQRNIGPQVGDTIPRFSLTDQHGEMQDFQSLRGPNGLVMLFHRSAAW